MKAFLIGLQFLTRIQVVKQTVWSEEDFGKSVRYFPLVGLVLGMLYGFLAWLLTWGLEDIVDLYQSISEQLFWRWCHFWLPGESIVTALWILWTAFFLAESGIECWKS